jgi:hypothetical protein
LNVLVKDALVGLAARQKTLAAETFVSPLDPGHLGVTSHATIA